MRLIALSFLLIALTGCNKGGNPKAAAASAPSAAKVPVLRIEARPFRATVVFTGTLVSRSQVDVKAETTGRVLRFVKQEGEPVQAGEELVWINDEIYKLDIRQTRSVIQVNEAALERAKVLASHAAAELERANNLITSGGITDKDLKAARVADQDARAQVALAQAQLDQAKAALAIAEKRQRDTIIRAPVSGEIQRRFVNPGAYLEPPTPVFTIVDNQRLEVETPVPTSDLAPLRPGQKVSFRVNAFPDQVFDGQVIEILPAVETDTRSARIRIAANNSSRKLRAGMFAEGEILTGVQANAIVIPGSAVYRDDRSAKETFVYLALNGKATKRNVRIGRERGSDLEITNGLQPGDLLIAEQSIEIADGTPVEARR